jgi:uncharacterized protein (TIGR03086 family)
MAVELEPATSRLSAIVRGVPDGMLDAPTPSDVSVAALLDHIQTFAAAFAAAARKDSEGPVGPPPPPDPSHLAADWQESIPRALAELARAWRAPDAWTGMTKIGGMDMPGEAAGIVALDEVVLHGWDLAHATGQPYEVETDVLEPLLGFVTHMAEPGMVAARDGLFGPVVAVPDDAPLLDRVVGLAGRDPGWTPAK